MKKILLGLIIIFVVAAHGWAANEYGGSGGGSGVTANNCPLGQYADGIQADGTLNCGTPAGGGTTTINGISCASGGSCTIADSTKATPAGIQAESYTAADDTGAANAYAITVSPAPSLGAYSWFSFKAAHANTTASTLSINGGTAYPIKKWGGTTALVGGEIAAGQIVRVIFDGTNFQMQSQSALGSARPYPPVTPHTGNATVADVEMQRGIITNTGASGTVTLTLPTCSATAYSAVFYITAAYTIKIIPDSGSQIMTLTSAANHSITSDATVGTFVGLTCLASGQWYMTGLNGSWTDTN